MSEHCCLVSANINPAISAFSANGSQGKDLYTDYGLDAGYQYLGDGTNIGTAYMLLVHEDQDLKGSFNTGASSQASSNLNQLRMNTTYFYKNTYGLTLAWQYTWGKANGATRNYDGFGRNASDNNTGMVAEVAQRVIVMYAGRKVEEVASAGGPR